MKTITKRRELLGSTIMTLRDSEFPGSTYDGWAGQVEKVLKGKPVQSLNIETLEGITIKPLYTDRPDHIDAHISRTWKSKAEWHLAQRGQGDSAEEVIGFMNEELKRGSEVAALDEKSSSIFNEVQAAEFLSLQDDLHIYIKCADLTPWQHVINNKRIKGILGRSCSTPDLDDEWLKGIIEIDQVQPELKSIILSSVPIHQKGANTVQELAFILSQAARVIQLAEKSGWSADKVISKMHAEFATGSDFFMEISKLRAFRAIWRHFTDQYQISANISISTETAGFTKLTQDEHTNMLRSGNEAFAAVLGGADYIYVRPYDCFKSASSSQAVRAARNIGLILKEEMFLQSLIDPAGGSYYIEHLTKEIAEKSWSRFCDFEDQGGLSAVYQDLMAEVKSTRDKRDYSVRTRKQSLVGMNKYAPADKTMVEHIPDTAGYDWDMLIQKVQKYPVNRIALVTVGELKDYKPRADFVKGVFAAAGVVPDFDRDQADVLIVCGADQAYDQLLTGVIEKKKPAQKMYIAGKVKSEGIDGCLYNGMDMVAFLENVLFTGIGGDHHEA
ncbi:methylmalonyl-CoA mutase family protein [Jeotgalibacillus haloalkalitolerans]|uniref:Methylmalonyl-CoA mutase family protein n=1 Tax=Jeotgalibacillus haloalkalitolerans TaxID=3104292 RepID=A0ABU5KLF6_9BACL|nr:methylmalonyl-CoA mutase family protein [Jeotgalibacillus sp. HH7-29]MDZ5712102.1 methylmalonyl-CoA mutase family protein [Jeotgalibacillus sp. HH7-29]